MDKRLQMPPPLLLTCMNCPPMETILSDEFVASYVAFHRSNP
jgi:hypothetical protein